MNLNALRNYEYVDFWTDLEELPGTHVYSIRREPEQTYYDEYAKHKLINYHQELYNQYIEGWSRSYYSHARHLEALLNYATADIPVTKLDCIRYGACINAVRTGLSSLPRVRAFDVLTELDEVSFKSSTAAGYDYGGTKGPIRGENHKRAMSRARAIVHDVHEKGVEALKNVIETMVPDVGYTRTQLTDLSEKTKVRNVWGRAFHYILIEGLIANPLIRAFQSVETFYHIGKDPLDSVPKALSQAARAGRWLYAIDWKQFDATVSRFEIEAAFMLVEEKVDFPNDQTAVAFYIAKQLFIHKKIAGPDGKFYWVHKGIPSGSYFTSIIGSIVNRLRIEYLWRTIIGRGPKCCFTQGDDSLSSDDEFIPPERFAEVANSIGWVFNPDKTEYSTIPGEVTFLGRTVQGGMNRRQLKRCIRLLILPEYPVESGRISAYRARSIAEDAGGLSAILNRIAEELEAEYGVASKDEVPLYFKRYIM
nr:RNA-dependent RNA polymerase [Helianthus annuus leaf-associated partitivirus 2]